MNRLLVPTALVLALAGTMAIAQTPTAPATQTPAPDAQRHIHHRHNPQKEADHVGKVLNLTPDQTAKLAPIFADRDQKMAALRGDGQQPPQDIHQQMRAIMKSTNDQLSTVLTPDQMQQLRSMRHEHHGHGRQESQPLTPPQGA